ncbi:14653_t:CDS:2, partial [Ambispora leptoticha]
MEDIEVNMEDYFEEAYCGYVNMNDLTTNFKAITISKGDLFSDFEEAEQYMKCYTEFKGFKTRRVLKQRYPSHPVFSKDLYKEIQKCKPSAQFNEGDAARFYKELLSKQHKDL